MMMLRAVLVLLLALVIPPILAFAPIQRNPRCSTEIMARLPKFFKWFRSSDSSAKQKQETPPPIAVGSKLPDVEVDQILATTGQGELVISPTSLKEAMGRGMSILVAMPAASTKSCTSIHMPGYKEATSSLLELGVKKIVILVTNEKFVNQERPEDAYILTTSDGTTSAERTALIQTPEASSPVTILVDAENIIMDQLGVTKEMGFTVRTNRLVVILENGTVKQVLREEGVKDGTATSATRLVEFLTPEDPVPEENPEAIEIDFRIIILLGAIVTIASYESLATFIKEQDFGWNLPFIPINGEDSPVEEVFQLLKDHL